jgi:hypothetical protein
MADQKKWFKVWTSIVANGAFAEMSLEDIGRWTLLGALTALDGDKGNLPVPGLGKSLCHILRVEDLTTAKVVLKRILSVQFEEGKSDNAEFAVTWRNWIKYQEDSTIYERVKKHREGKKCNGLRGEERRGDKKRSVNTPCADGDGVPANGFSEWPEEWNAIRNLVTGESALPFLAEHKTWLVDLDWWVTMKALFSSCPAPLSNLVTEAAAYIQGEGYHPRSKAGIRQKLKNCMEFAAKKAERGGARGNGKGPVYPKL